MSTRNKNKNKNNRKRKRSSKNQEFNRTLDFPSKAASAAAAAAGLPNSDRIASNAMSNDLFVRPTHLSTGFLIRYNENDSAAAPAQRSNSARTTSSSLSELNAIQGGPESYVKYLDNKKNTETNITRGTNTSYAEIGEDGDVKMGGRKTRRKKRRRKTKKRRKTKRKKRRRKRKTKKRRK